jgi:hypothetical protein
MNGKVNWTMNGKRCKAPKSLASPVKYYLQREDAIRAAQQASVGCNHGFRKAAKFSSREELESLRNGEDKVGLNALIANGAHPGYMNGPLNPRPFHIIAGKVVRVKR